MIIDSLPKAWSVVELKDCTEKITDGTHSTVKDNPEGECLLLSCKNIKDGQICTDDNDRRIDKETLLSLRERTGLQKHDILLTTVGTVGESAIVEMDDVNFEIQRSVAILRANPKIVDPKFLYLFTKTPLFLHQTLMYSRGSVQKCLFLEGIREIKIPLPPLKEQHTIVQRMQPFDEKIRLNASLANTLEAIGKALFKHWFIDFEFPNEKGEPYKSSGGEMVDSELGEIPKGWSAGKLKEIFSINMGQSPLSKYYNEEGQGLPFYQGIRDFGQVFPTPNVWCAKPTKIAETGDILFSVRAPVGAINIAPHQCCIGRGLCSIRSAFGCQGFAYYLTLHITEKLTHTYSGQGTVFGSVSKGDLYGFELVLPPESLQKDFHDIVTACMQKALVSSKEAIILEQIRHALLPKLMSGEIRVPVSERIAAEVSQ